jgi:hypothetical protein
MATVNLIATQSWLIFQRRKETFSQVGQIGKFVEIITFSIWD